MAYQLDIDQLKVEFTLAWLESASGQASENDQDATRIIQSHAIGLLMTCESHFDSFVAIFGILYSTYTVSHIISQPATTIFAPLSKSIIH